MTGRRQPNAAPLPRFGIADAERLLRAAGATGSIAPDSAERLADGLTYALHQMLHTLTARSTAPARSAISADLLDLAKIASSLLHRQLAGSAVVRQREAMRPALRLLGAYHNRALADAAAGPRPLKDGFALVEAAISALNGDGRHSNDDGEQALRCIIEWSSAAGLAHRVTIPSHERDRELVRRFTLIALEIAEGVTGRNLRLARDAYGREGREPDEPYGPAISFLTVLFELLRASIDGRCPAPLLPLFSPTPEMLAAWIRARGGEKWTGNKRRPRAA